MKKLSLVLIAILIVAMLTGCGAKKCYSCEKEIEGKSYTAFGNRYCEDCFLYDLGI